ncbi:flagellar hook-associated protein FlgL [Halomonas sp. WWR20]
MRISTVTMFEQSVSSMNRQQSNFMQVGQQIATGRRVVSPSDDPQAASRAVGVSQSSAVNEQQKDSRISARNALSQEESVLGSVSDAIASAKTLIVQAGNGTLSNADREAIASELNGIYETLIGQANATNGNGSYLFGGYRDSAPPFVRKDGAESDVEYVGDRGVRTQQVDASRQMAVNDTGESIFNSLQNGAGYTATAVPKEDSEGNLTFTGPTVTDSSAASKADAFVVSFSVSVDAEGNSTTTYSTDGGATQTAYSDGKTIDVNGLSLTLEGQPADGDSISVGPAEEQFTSIFDTLKSALDVLKNPVDTDAKQAALENTLSTVSRQLDGSLDNVLTVRASAGARLNELDVLDTVGSNRNVSYEQTLSDLVDLDYNKALSDYALRQVGLQASQKAFVDVQGMSLLNFLK